MKSHLRKGIEQGFGFFGVVFLLLGIVFLTYAFVEPSQGPSNNYVMDSSSTLISLLTEINTTSSQSAFANCRMVSNTGNSISVDASCAGDEVIVTGGCAVSSSTNLGNLIHNSPISDSSWRCRATSSTYQEARAICCDK